VDGISVGPIEEYSFKGVTESHNIAASFAPKTTADYQARPRRSILQWLLPFIFCGLGQVYKGETRKGISFMILYSLSILSLFAALSSQAFMQFLTLYSLMAIWSTGVIDFYLDNPDFVEITSWLIQKKAMFEVLKTVMVLNIVIPGIAIAAFWTQHLIEANPTVKEETPKYERYEPAITHKEAESTISMIACSLEPSIAQPGDRLRIKYEIKASRALDLGLVCSIRKVGSNDWINDPSNDKVISADQGTGEYYREFELPGTLSPGLYTVGWGIWDSDFTFAYDFKSSRNILSVVIP
jgi:hypothetical protein